LEDELRLAARQGDVAKVKEFLTKGANVDCASKRGFTPLISACIGGFVEVVEFLLQHKGCNLELKTVDGTTALFEACRKGHFEIVQQLVHAGADLDNADIDGFRPVFISSQEGNDDVVSQHDPCMFSSILFFFEQKI
jgi:ankyrin repeat protein